MFKNPKDYPSGWVLRGFDVKEATVRAHRDCFVASSLDEVRARVPVGRVRTKRNIDDDPTVYESWI